VKLSERTLLVAAIVLLVFNLLWMAGVHGAAPAQAQADRKCVGVAAACTADGSEWVVYRAWSDGTVEARTAYGATGGMPRF
jgi:hypothetical protein